MSTLNVASIQSISSNPPVFKNSSGTEKGQLAKVWIHFSGNDNSIRDSFNVSSIEDLGTGAHKVHFENSLSNNNYCCVTASGEYSNLGGNNPERIPRLSNFNVGSVIFCNRTATGGSGDDNYHGLAIFGDN